MANINVSQFEHATEQNLQQSWMCAIAIETELRPIYFDRLQGNVGQYCWVREGTQALLTMFAFAVLGSSLLAIAYGSSSKTPVATCCPPGSFLAIEDWQESRQLPNGLWVDAIISNSMEERQITPPMWSFLRRSKDGNATRSDYRKVHRYGRHNFILGVSCVPDKNNLQPIDGLRGSSYPDPPYFASVQDKLLGLETRSKPLADNQILHSTGMFSLFLFSFNSLLDWLTRW